MTFLIKKPADIRPSEITSESVYNNRRTFVKAAGFAGAASLLGTTAACAQEQTPAGPGRFGELIKSEYSTSEAPSSFEDVTSYNNFYEFGLGKDDPIKNSGDFRAKPWTVTVDGEAEVTGTFDYDDIIKRDALEERIYRFRCVEAWSMVVPWVGVPLGDVIKRFKPTSKAKYVAFETVFRPEEMPGQRRPYLQWPYVEGLRMDEAMHPLSILAVGVYGQELPNQNGAPIRLMTPWKYGFKGIKSIVRISFVEQEPPTSWNVAAPNEYGFYANVNPQVDHPRWSQARERRIGDGLFAAKRETLMFNGYADEVAGLYSGMDLSRYY